MGNASKAIIIAGGILITMLVISLALYMFTAVRGVSSASEQRVAMSQIESFNRFFENYPETVTGLDVYNIIGKINDIDNDSYSVADAPGYSGAHRSDVTSTIAQDKKRYKYSIIKYGNDGAVSEIYFDDLAAPDAN